MNKQGSSETTREASIFNLQPFLSYYSANDWSKNTIVQQPTRTFLEWFIGFTEGDGSFQVVKYPTIKNPKNTRPIFTINQKEPEILYTIKKKLGFGTVIKIKADKNVREHYRYRVYKLNHIFQLISLFQGNLVLKKVHTRFQLWVESYNLLCDQRNSGSLAKDVTFGGVTIINLNSAWLTGFTDAEGCFYASGKIKGNSISSPHFKFSLVQKHGLELLERIATLVSTNQSVDGVSTPRCTKSIYKIKTKIETYRLEYTKKADLLIFIDVFDKYPLLCRKKRLTYVRWKRLFFRALPIPGNDKILKRYKRLILAVGKLHRST